MRTTASGLQIEGVHKSFDHRGTRQHVLRGVDLEVKTGEFISFIGHSGCGKSTLLNVVGGLLAPDSGRVTLDGVTVRSPGPDRAMVFQNYSLLPRMSLLDNVRTAVCSARVERGRIHAAELSEKYLRAVGLWEARNKRPGQVSGGMQQRAAVARAFAVEPRVLLLDEPFGALDALTRGRLQQQLISLWQSESETEMVLMVTHGIEEAIRLADRIVVMAPSPQPSVMEIIDVDLPRPRDPVQVVEDPRFRVVQERLMKLLTDEEHVAA
ncbi:MAG: ABC transporter ATP-binding protein [Acidimicrobiales bacterium]